VWSDRGMLFRSGVTLNLTKLTIETPRFKCTSITVSEFYSFEVLMLSIHCLEIVLCVMVYHPPKPNSNFMLEFSEFIFSLVVKHDHIIVAGDFHIDIPSKIAATDFINLTESFNMTQHVMATLWIWEDIFQIILVVFLMSCSKFSPKRKIIIFSLASLIHRQLQKQILSQSENLYATCSTDVSLNTFNKLCQSTLDEIVSFRSRSRSESKPHPWLDENIRKLKKTCRKELLLSYNKAIRDVKAGYSSELIASNCHNPYTPVLQPPAVPLLSCFMDTNQHEIDVLLRKMKPSTCELDPFPSILIKSHSSVVSPMITKIINQSLRSGQVPASLKTAFIKPLLKKPSLDPEVFANYRPISNLPFLSKVLEKVVSVQLHNHLITNSLYEKFQSGFHSGHSTETALVRVTNDLLMAADAGSPSLLILLDLTAAFDTEDHHILLNRLHSSIGLSDITLAWFTSYLTDRTEYVSLGGAKSDTHSVTCVVPQGSVLGPTLFTLYMLPLGHVISRHGISFHCYADDTQLYIKTNPTPATALSTLSICLEEIETWMADNFLQLNSSKTEAILVGTPHQTRSSTITSITFSGHDIHLSSSVTNLGVRMDPHLTYDAHIKHLCKTSFFHLRNIAKLRPTLTLPDAEKLVHAFISSRLDYCNSLLIGIPSKNIQPLQYVQNCAARILMGVRKHHHITPILKSLHWLPVQYRIEFKVSLLSHQCLYGTAPLYLKQIITPLSASRHLRSGQANLLQPLRTRLRTMGDRAFCSVAPALWNALPVHLRAPQTVDSFKKGLKTHLFRKAFFV
uniref:Reverse transcriptase domain-containing protein n=1 Tax=Esox lucius TaxID=8010 RepID=A0A6Q2XW77_ESOLU